MRKKESLVVISSGGGELTNQLWNYISIYAYGLYSNTKVFNPSFFEYHRYFRLIKAEGIAAKFFSYWFRKHIRRRAYPVNQFWRKIYAVYAKAITLLNSRIVLSSQTKGGSVVYLPPTKALKQSPSYFVGWLFRNPVGLNTYREELIEAFRPIPSIESQVSAIIQELRSTGTYLIGVHVRQADYSIFKGGIYLLSQERMRKVVDEYVKNNSIENCTLLITSDGPIHREIFSGYQIYVSKENAVTDLFLLASCDVIIGSNSSFGHFASWYGNIPHIVAENGPMDWEYYRGRNAYFENRYATLARLS